MENKMVKVETKTGFTCEINKDALDDWEFAKAAASIDNADAVAALRLSIYMAEHMLSPEDEKRLEEHVKTEDGRVPTSRMMEEIENILSSVKETKNS